MQCLVVFTIREFKKNPNRLIWMMWICEGLFFLNKPSQRSLPRTSPTGVSSYGVGSLFGGLIESPFSLSWGIVTKSLQAMPC